MVLKKSHINIRQASILDAALLADIGAISFRETFAADNNPADIKLHLETSYNIETIRQALNDPAIIYLIAENQGAALGFARLNFAGAPVKITLKGAIELQQIYVLKRGWGKGFGPALLEQCIEITRQRKKTGLWLGVWEKNKRGIAFYKKWGFEITGKHTFMLGNDPQQDFLMELAFGKQ